MEMEKELEMVKKERKRKGKVQRGAMLICFFVFVFPCVFLAFLVCSFLLFCYFSGFFDFVAFSFRFATQISRVSSVLRLFLSTCYYFP